MFVCSGGGHLAEMLQLKPLFGKYRSVLITDTKAMIPSNDFQKGYLLKGSRSQLIKFFFIFVFNSIKSTFYFFRYFPDVIITTGAHTAVPLCYLGAFFKKEVIFIESIARVKSKSLTGKLIEKICTHIFVQWHEMLDVYPGSIYIGRLF